MQLIFIFCIGNANFECFYYLPQPPIGKIFLEKSPFGRLLKSINMDHIWIPFALRVVFAVKIWKKTSMIVWTSLCGPDYHTLPQWFEFRIPDHIGRLIGFSLSCKICYFLKLKFPFAGYSGLWFFCAFFKTLKYVKFWLESWLQFHMSRSQENVKLTKVERGKFEYENWNVK